MRSEVLAFSVGKILGAVRRARRWADLKTFLVNTGTKYAHITADRCDVEVRSATQDAEESLAFCVERMVEAGWLPLKEEEHPNVFTLDELDVGGPRIPNTAEILKDINDKEGKV